MKSKLLLSLWSYILYVHTFIYLFMYKQTQSYNNEYNFAKKSMMVNRVNLEKTNNIDIKKLIELQEKKDLLLFI